MTRHYPDLGSASDWLNQISQAARPIRSTTQFWVVTRHQYGISALVSILRRHFTGKPVMALRNAGCFLSKRTCETRECRKTKETKKSAQ